MPSSKESYLKMYRKISDWIGTVSLGIRGFLFTGPMLNENFEYDFTDCMIIQRLMNYHVERLKFQRNVFILLIYFQIILAKDDFDPNWAQVWFRWFIWK